MIFWPCLQTFLALLVLFSDDFNAGPGTGTDWEFCTVSRPCTSRHGDCDSDSECVQDHTCGVDNCYKFWSAASLTADCCVPGNFIIWMTCPTEVFSSSFFWPWFETSEVKLVGGQGPHCGNIIVGGRPVCDDGHNAANALVVCRFAQNTKYF